MKTKKIFNGSSALAALCAALCVSAFAERPVKYSEVEFDLTAVSLQTLGDIGLPIDHHAPGEGTLLSMPVSQYDLDLLKAQKIPYRLLIDDAAKAIEQRNIAIAKAAAAQEKPSMPPPVNFKLGTFGGYLTLAEMVKDLDEMKTKYPNLISAKFEIGKSVEGRSIWAVRLSDKANTEQNRVRVFYDGLIHAREPISMMHLMYFMWSLLENYAADPEARNCLNNVELVIVPCTNPDGYEYNRSTNPSGGGLWRKNRSTNPDGSRGVDLNRNFSTFWGDNSGSSGVGSSDTYRGTAAFSEPETRALRDVRPPRKFALSFNHHSYANRLLTPFGIGGWPANRADYERIAGELTRTTGWQFGPTPVMLGYSVSGGAKDWGHSVGLEYAFGSETGASSDGFWPIQSRITPISAGVLDMNMAMCREAQAIPVPSLPRRIHPDFSLNFSSARGQWNLDYLLTDAGRSWYANVYDMRGKLRKRFALAAGEHSISLSRGALPGLGLLEVSACGAEGCKSMHRQKLVPGGF